MRRLIRCYTMDHVNEVLDINSDVIAQDVSYESLGDVARVDARDLTYSEFFNAYMLRNEPVILKNVSTDWKCSKLWLRNGSLDTDYFRENYGGSEVPVSNCGKKWFNIQEKCTMRMKEYLTYWEEYGRRGSDEDCLYLKDWHFTKEYPGEDVYRVPPYFASDWLNEYYDRSRSLNDDFRFVYIGPKGSWTPFHCDVLTSFSWSANVSGRKKWILIRPGDEEHLKDSFGHLKYDIEEVGTVAKAFQIVQERGEAVFVPSGWHHQVWNLEDAISVNHNWINACNLLHVWDSLKKSLSEVKREISDCKESTTWSEDCQQLLAATFGCDYRRFYHFLWDIARPRMESLNLGENLVVGGSWSMGRNHMVFDLSRILKMLKILIEDSDFVELNFDGEDECPERFMRSLEDFLHCQV